MIRLFILSIFTLMSGYSWSQDNQADDKLIAASQGQASSVFFESSDPLIPVVSPGNFQDSTECYIRNGLPHFFQN